MSYPRIIAHRGGGALAPENTLAGIRIAARLGCRGVEFDAMLAADGVPVLIHDETLARTTSGHGRVADIDSAELARLDAGGRHHPAFAGEPAPTLDAALRLCAALGLWANVEIKPSSGQEAATGRVVARHAAPFGNLLLSSFSTEALHGAAAEAAALPRAILVEAIPPDWRQRMRDVGAQSVHASQTNIDVEAVRELLAARVPLACYTVNRRGAAESLLAKGVSAVFSDRPDLWSASEM